MFLTFFFNVNIDFTCNHFWLMKNLCFQKILGMLGVFFQLLLVVGILCAYCSGFSENAVTISIICGVAPILFAVIMIFMPESPLFYILKDKEESARKVLRYFRGEDFDIQPEIRDFKVCFVGKFNFHLS